MAFASKLAAKIFGNAVNNVLTGFTDALISFDPQAASEAQLETFRDQIETFSKTFVQARDKLAKERQDVERIDAEIGKNIRALGVLKTRLDALQPADTARAGLVSQATMLDATITRLNEQKVVEVKEEELAAQFFTAISGALDKATAKFEQARRRLGSVVHDLKMAKLAKQLADEELAQVKEIDRLRAAGGDDSDPMARIAAVAAGHRQDAEATMEAATRIKTATGADTANLADDILAGDAPATEAPDPFRHLNH